MKSNYNPRTNRCYVELDAAKIDDPDHFHHETLFDGQTREILAFTELEGKQKRAAVFAKNDRGDFDLKTDWHARAASYMDREMEDDRTD